MIQKTYTINNFSSREFTDTLETVRELKEYRRAKQVLLVVFENNWDSQEIMKKVRKIKMILPKAEIAGVTHYNGTSTYMQMYLNQTVLSFMFFENPSFMIYSIPMDNLSEMQIGRQLNTLLTKTPHLKGVMMFASLINKHIDMILKSASNNIRDVPFFGATAAAYIRETDFRSIVFDEEDCYHNALVSVIFFGNNLNIHVSCNFGWTPIGKSMTITSTSAPDVVDTIDDMPAAQIYKRYLGLELDQIHNWENLYDFPLCIERNGMLIGRIPTNALCKGQLHFTNDIYKGEKIRFTYGDQTGIFSNIHKDSDKHFEFAPQAMLLVICPNRAMFLADHEEKEREFYSRFAPELAYMQGTSEIYMYNDVGGQLSSMLVAASFREGSKSIIPEVRKLDYLTEDHISHEATVPLQYRIMTFFGAVTNDLEEVTAQAVKANESKSDFLSHMSHEIRTPINAVLGMNEMILRESSDSQIREYAADIQNAGITLLSIINDILDLSKIESGKMEIIPVFYDLPTLIHNLSSMISIKAKAKGLSFHVDVAEDLPTELFGDDLRIRQILTNILTNAVKYTERGSVTMRISGKQDNKGMISLHFEVEDTGIGIKEEDLPKLFMAFERIEEKRNRKIEGTGLGLNITISLLHLMGSELQVRSTYGKGSIFYFDLEQKIINDTQIGNYEQKIKSISEDYHYEKSFTAPEGKVLVVDDNALNIKVFCSLLKDTELQITKAYSGKEALRSTQETKFDIIFLDHMMPEMDGIETLRALKEQTDNPNIKTPVFALTANAVAGSREKYLAAGFDGFLSKPVRSEKLESVIRELLPEDKIIISKADKAPVEKNAPSTDDLPTIEGMDWNYAFSHLPPDRQMLLEAVEDFYHMIKAQSEKLCQFFDDLSSDDKATSEKALDSYRIQVHGMKSAAAVVGITLLSGMANRLEIAARDKETAVILGMHNIFIESWNSYREKLSVLFEEPEEKNELPSAKENLAKIYARLEILKNAMETLDVDEADASVDDISRFSYPDEAEEMVEQLKQSVMALDADLVNSLADKLIKLLE